jgi:hypothetical protein
VRESASVLASSEPSGSDGVLMCVLVAAELFLVVWLLRLLIYHPAPPFARMSMRRHAIRQLRPAAGRDRVSQWWARAWEQLPGLRLLVYLAFVVAAFVPVELKVGPFNSASESEDYLKTLWQVVAAALGLSVAIVAFAFEAFTGHHQRAYGGNLREFGRTSGLVFVIELGVLSLLFTGAVLLGLGHGAPGGWSAALAVSLSAATLLGVLYAVHRILRLLDRRQMLLLRQQRLRGTVQEALRQQLIGQLAEVRLANAALPVTRSYFAMAATRTITANRAGEVDDILLGRLARYAIKHRRRDQAENSMHVAVGIGDRTESGRPILYVPQQIAPTWARDRYLRGSVKLRRADEERADLVLVSQLQGLHEDAMDAARSGGEQAWREVADVYELVLLGLPRAADHYGIPFAGAVAAPGFIGHGPVQRIARFLYDELDAAVQADRRELVDPISYFPQHIATEAMRLKAPAIAQEMLRLYPAMYAMARRAVR